MHTKTIVTFNSPEEAEAAGKQRGIRGFSEIYWGPVYVGTQNGRTVWQRTKETYSG